MIATCGQQICGYRLPLVFSCIRCIRSAVRPTDLRRTEFLDIKPSDVIQDPGAEPASAGQAADIQRKLPKNHAEYDKVKRSPVQQPADAKFLNVSVIGAPNAGKSTMTNRLMGTKVSAVSKRVHTTRCNIMAILVENNVQVVFSDSPGLVTREHCAKHNLAHTFVTSPKRSVKAADLIMCVVDASNPRDQKKLCPGIVQKLSQANKPSILILNKVDCIKKKRRLFDIAYQLTDGKIEGRQTVEAKPLTLPADSGPKIPPEVLAEKRVREKGYILELPKVKESDSKFPGLEDIADENQEEQEEEVPISWPHFSRVFMVSALTGEGVDDVKKYLLDAAKPGDWKYPAEMMTTQKPEYMVLMTVREKLLDTLQRELPYVIRTKINSWSVNREETLCVGVDILVPKQRYVSEVLGEKGSIISRIADESRQELSDAFHCDVSLKLIVKCTEELK